MPSANNLFISKNRFNNHVPGKTPKDKILCTDHYNFSNHLNSVMALSRNRDLVKNVFRGKTN